LNKELIMASRRYHVTLQHPRHKQTGKGKISNTHTLRRHTGSTKRDSLVLVLWETKYVRKTPQDLGEKDRQKCKR